MRKRCAAGESWSFRRRRLSTALFDLNPRNSKKATANEIPSCMLDSRACVFRSRHMGNSTLVRLGFLFRHSLDPFLLGLLDRPSSERILGNQCLARVRRDLSQDRDNARWLGDQSGTSDIIDPLCGP
jgi:hypothetical protein